MLTLLAFVVGAALGAAGYRYMVKNDPVTLEKWAAEIKARADSWNASQY